jgi:hypothetical protein
MRTSTHSPLTADFAMTLSRREAEHPEKLATDAWYWTGWTRRLWPANIIRPGLRIYGFDPRPLPVGRRLCVLLEITRGGSFSYSSKASFGREVKALTGWRPDPANPHFDRIPSGNVRQPCTGIAMRWRVVDATIPALQAILRWQDNKVGAKAD